MLYCNDPRILMIYALLKPSRHCEVQRVNQFAAKSKFAIGGKFAGNIFCSSLKLCSISGHRLVLIFPPSLIGVFGPKSSIHLAPFIKFLQFLIQEWQDIIWRRCNNSFNDVWVRNSISYSNPAGADLLQGYSIVGICRVVWRMYILCRGVAHVQLYMYIGESD